MLRKLGGVLLLVLAYGGFFAAPFLRYLKIDFIDSSNQIVWQCLWAVTALASSVGSFFALERLWTRTRSGRLLGLVLLCMFAAPVLINCGVSQAYQIEFNQTSSQFEQQSAKMQTILTLYVEQTQLDPDPAIRAQAAQQLFKRFALQGTWLDSNGQLQLYKPTSEELETAQSIKAERAKARASFDTFITTRFQLMLQEMQEALIITIMSYLAGLFLLLVFRAWRGTPA